MARRRKIKQPPTDPLAKKPHENDLMWRGRIARLVQNERDRSQPLVTAEARQHAAYVDMQNGAKQNMSATPLTRWRANKTLSVSQLGAIYHYLRLVDIACTPPGRITGSYAETIRGGVHNNEETEERQNAVRDAKQDLHRMQDYIPPHYWEIFENCIRFDEPAGVAGSRLGYGDRTAQARAHQVVCFVADIIAMREGIRY